jgi:hypothetical protein
MASEDLLFPVYPFLKITKEGVWEANMWGSYGSVVTV